MAPWKQANVLVRSYPPMTQSTPLALELEAGSDALDTCNNSQNTT